MGSGTLPGAVLFRTVVFGTDRTRLAGKFTSELVILPIVRRLAVVAGCGFPEWDRVGILFTVDRLHIRKSTWFLRRSGRDDRPIVRHDDELWDAYPEKGWPRAWPSPCGT
jgi:hypothetical protein